MESENKDNKLRVGGGLFYFIWILVILLIGATLIFGAFSESKELNFILFLVLIGILLLPFLKSFNVGKVFGMELKNLNSNVEKLRDTIINFNLSNKQEIQFISMNEPDGQNLRVKTVDEARKKLTLGNSLIQQGRLLESIDANKEVLKLDPNNWIAAMYLGFSYLTLTDAGIDQSKWGFEKEEGYMKSIYYSLYATILDPNHYNQFMNLAIAQKHLGGEGLIKLAIKNMQMAFDMLNYDPSVLQNPILFMNKAKARSFMGEFAEAIGLIDDAKKYRKEAIEIFEKCPEPKPADLEKWKKDALDSLRKLDGEK